ncbi:MAG: hypothetical protein AAGK10_07335 [Cyanobacteria bacterium J06555_3]
MTSTRSTNSVIIITGMHRSGTSLTASLLQSAGVYLGDRLMSADSGNAKGYFEDWDCEVNICWCSSTKSQSSK